MNLGTARIIQADSRNLPLPDNSVDLVITSPPYFALRSYQDGCKTCADSSKSHMRGYMERYCPGCNKVGTVQKCPKCDLTTLRTEATKEAIRKRPADPDCPECKGTGKGHYAGQIGDEPTPAEFVESLLEVTRECVRVLKPSGSLWVNLGDKYAGQPRGAGFNANTPTAGRAVTDARAAGVGQGGHIGGDVRAKSLIGIPWRYALRCIDDLGLILRAEVIWSKPNGLPESVTDRVRRSHEVWFHFVQQPRYFSAVDEIREPHVATETRRDMSRWRTGPPNNRGLALDQAAGKQAGEFAISALGKLPGSVWTVPTEPLRVPDHLGVDHFAAFPTEWPKRIIQGWSPAGVCVECGEGRRPVVGYGGPHELAPQRVLTSREVEEWSSRFAAWCKDNGVTRRALAEASGTGDMGARWLGVGGMASVPNPEHWRLLRAAWPSIPEWFDKYVHKTELLPVRGGNFQASEGARKSGGAGAKQFHHKEPPLRAVTGYACACPEPTAPTTPGVVLDPFGGTGTTAMVAKALGRDGISVDMSADYCRLAEWRCNDRDQLAKVLGIEKADPVHEDEQSLLDLLGGEDVA